MKNTFKKILIIATFVVASSCMTFASEHQAANINAEQIQARADLIDWRYKTIDGKMYKRLYNYTTGEWVGDWILVE